MKDAVIELWETTSTPFQQLHPLTHYNAIRGVMGVLLFPKGEVVEYPAGRSIRLLKPAFKIS